MCLWTRRPPKPRCSCRRPSLACRLRAASFRSTRSTSVHRCVVAAELALATVLVVGAALLGDLADRGGIELVYRLCSYLPALGLLTALLPDVESGARRLEPARPDPEADTVPLV